MCIPRKIISTVVGWLLMMFSDISVADQQAVMASSNQSSVSAGDTLVIDVFYDNDNKDPSLSGLGLRLYYDSSIMKIASLGDFLDRNLVIKNVESMIDTDDSDNDPSTDRFVLVAWASLNNDWPGMGLPVLLLKARFEVLSDEKELTTINFNSSSTAAGYDFSGDRLEVQIRN